MPSATIGEALTSSGGSIRTGPFGTKLAASEYSPHGVPVISVGEIGYGRVRIGEHTKRVGPDVTERLPEYLLRPGDIVFGRKGAVDRSAWIRPHEGGYFLGSDGIRLRFGDAVNSRFLAYQLQSGRVRRWLLQHAVGTTLASLNEPTLKALPIDLPSLEEQQSIAATLGALDEKIESNSIVIRTIPELIRGKVRAALDSGVETAPVSALATFVNGGAYTKGASGSGRMVLRIAELNSGPGPSTVYNDIEVPEDKTARPGDILMSWSGSLGVYRWCREEAIINQHIFKVIPKSLPAWLVFDRVDQVVDVFRQIARDKATTMGHIQRVHLDSTLVELPRAEAIQALDMELSMLWTRLLVAELESMTLAELRDTLLPELMSGRLRVAPFAATKAAEGGGDV